MSADDSVLRFTIDDLATVLGAMAHMTEQGQGWINIGPADVDPPPPMTVWGRINGRGPQVPRLTWTAPRTGRNKTEPAEVGIEHPSGGRALEHLAGAGHPLPAGWRRTQDHAMRGLVVVPPPDVADSTVLTWALGATAMLGGVPLDGEWTARLFGP